jgi:hypothetical protein
MKKTLMLCGTAMVLAITGGRAPAAIVTIDDLLDGLPAVTTDLASQVITATFQQAIVSGNITPTNQSSGFSPVGTRSVIFLEPADDPFGPRISDFLTLTVSDVQQDATGAQFQPVRIFFQSDGAANFDANVAGLPANTPTILEDGTFQSVSPLLNSGAFQISVRSDLATQEPTPEPKGIVLLGIGSVLTAACLCLGRRLSGV